jgi:hypothetical protein
MKMPVKIELALREGWKATQNERFGEVLEVRFVNADDGKVLWRYAPKLEDKETWDEAFVFLEEYDKALKVLKGLVGKIDGRVYKLGGNC